MEVKKEPLVVVCDFMKIPETCSLEKYLQIQGSCISAQRRHAEMSVKDELHKNHGFIQIMKEENQETVSYYIHNTTGLCDFEPIKDIKKEEEEEPGQQDVKDSDDLYKDEMIYKPVSRPCRNCGQTFRSSASFRRHQLEGCERTNTEPTTTNPVSEQTHNIDSNNSHLQQPLVHNEKKKGFFCDVCNKSFKRKSFLIDHQFVHSDIKKHECELCQKRFARKRQLVQHLRMHTGEKPYQCSVCQKSFSQKRSLTKHMRIHIDDRPFSCLDCGKHFHTQPQLRNHVRRRCKKTRACKLCNKPFTDLSQHQLDCCERKPEPDESKSALNDFCCDVCNKSFKRKGSLIDHQFIHSNIKEHECELCQKQFARKRQLVQHLRMHTGEKPYQCRVCQKSFCQKRSLTKHMRNHPEPGEIQSVSNNDGKSLVIDRQFILSIKDHECELCHKKFAHARELENHLRIHRDRPFSCETCHKTFKFEVNLKKHLEIHTTEKPHECYLCPMKFRTEELLNQHKLTHNEKFWCSQCGKVFLKNSDLKMHMTEHADEKPYKCNTHWTKMTFFEHVNLKKPTKMPVKSFSCPICRESFPQLHQRKWHLEMIHDIKEVSV